jgi:FtsP/CotA-like multicopper oxidase with cupredoxin domain
MPSQGWAWPWPGIGIVRLAAALTLLGGWAAPAWADAAHPSEYRSTDGVLTVTLEAGPQKVDLGPFSFDGLVYNGQFSGPLLRVKRGDLLRITLVNHLTEPTNLHFHGMESSPLGNGDNVHLALAPGKSFLYEVRIPKTQPPGIYWYHAHIHHLSDRQVSGGLSGPLLVEGFAEQFPALAGVTQQLLGLQEVAFDDSPDPIIHNELHDRVQTINGALSTTIILRPGETQLWFISNRAAGMFFDLKLTGHRFRILGEDGATAQSETVVDSLRIKPAGRYAVLVDAGEPGSYSLVSRRVPTGVGSARTLERVLGQLVVEGAPALPVPTIEKFPEGVDLSSVAADAERSVTFSENATNFEYYINGRKFDPERVDTRVPLGSIEQWTVRNDSDDLHVFHIHQVHFQVIAVNGDPKPFDGYVDTVNVPERGSVTVRIPFTHPEIVGRFMYHCHILAHEDKGMMAQIEIYDPAKSSRPTLWEWLTSRLRPADGTLLASICRFNPGS